VTAGLLEVRDLRKVFHENTRDEFVAVSDVSLDLEAGESLGIVGESGSGKTTIARMITGLLESTSGRIAVAGRDRSRPSRRSAERRLRGREVQIVMQDPYTSLDPRQTVRSCLREILRLHVERSKAGADRVAELLHAVGLEHRTADSLPGALSGGQRQRVAIARALAAEPRVLVLDEATSALDVSIQAQILNLLADLRRDTGIAYLFISHNLAVIRQVCDEAIVLKDGRIVERGSVDAVLDAPRESYTKLLRASVPGRGWRPQRRSHSTVA
jgi:peptide/nickel transport system ATP-binding protein